MSGVICAIRGGAASQPTIDRAIEAAREANLPLIFLYVVNIDFLMHTAHSRVQTITRELWEMGEFILLAAQARAAAGGVHATGVVREGNVGEEIVALCRAQQASVVVLGRPRAAAAEDVFTPDRLEQFGRHIQEQTSAVVLYAAEGS